MRSDEAITLFAYDVWANERVLAAAARLPADRLVAPAPVSHGSLLGALAHVLAAERTWRLRCQEGVSPAVLPTAADFPTLEALREACRAEGDAWRGFLAALPPRGLDRRVRYTNTRGVAFETPLWQVVAHVVNHGTQFRAEAAAILTQEGVSPGDLDLIAFLRARSG